MPPMLRLKCPLSLQRQLFPFLLSSLVFAWGGACAQRPDSLKQHLTGLLAQYQGHTLSDTAYLKAVDSAAPLLVHDDSLEQLLSTYQQIAFGNKRLGAYRGHYYADLALYSYNKNKYGSAIYYSEKNNDEKIKGFNNGVSMHLPYIMLCQGKIPGPFRPGPGFFAAGDP